jgi:type IV pilus assembly protein PilV
MTMNSTTICGPGRARPRGFTLLEVLIALVVLSIGLLGIAALQGVGLRSSHGAQLASQAGLLAYDMADRIRANPQTLITYDGFSTDSVDCEQALPTTPLADADLAEWACTVEALLPAGAGSIAGTPGSNPGVIVYTITVEWEDRQVRQVEEEEDVIPWNYVLVIEL